MMKLADIKQAVARLVDVAKPQRVILFGSYARGNATENSDLDLLVIIADIKDKGLEMVQSRQAIGFVGVGVDLLIFSEDEVKEKSSWCSHPIYWAVREGKVLYDSAQQ